MPTGGVGRRLGGTSSDDHDLTVVGDETVDGCEVRNGDERRLSSTVGTDTSRTGGRSSRCTDGSSGGLGYRFNNGEWVGRVASGRRDDA
jgi:hypothetical protein